MTSLLCSDLSRISPNVGLDRTEARNSFRRRGSLVNKDRISDLSRALSITNRSTTKAKPPAAMASPVKSKAAGATVTVRKQAENATNAATSGPIVSLNSSPSESTKILREAEYTMRA